MDRPLLENLFSSHLSVECRDRLEAPFSEEEVRATVFSMDKDKSLGSDGFYMHFYQVCWDILKSDLMKVFMEFFDRGVISKGMNAIFIVLVPKKEGAYDFSDFRPISLMSSLYKIISKVLSLRLRLVMDEVVSCSPGAFIRGRQIVDSILIANKLVDSRKKVRS